MSLNRQSVRLRIRNDRWLTGKVHITEGQSLATFLSTKLNFLNLTEVQWAGQEDKGPLSHLSVRLDQIVWVEPLDAELRLSSAALPSTEVRRVELEVDGVSDQRRLQVEMNVSRETRMSDYLDANPGFIPLWSVRIEGAAQPVERLAVNHRAILVVRELDDTDPKLRT